MNKERRKAIRVLVEQLEDKGVENVRLKGWRFRDSDKPKVQAVIDGSKKKKPRK